ncbi:MAG: hypothetical protein L6R35_006760 [Caloplaca aegaea]|nr:MAG: hypothetical protein L6R35_006760 [Caloplaca aegaea]
MNYTPAQAGAGALEADLMDWHTDNLQSQSCSNNTCHDDCSRDDCTQLCDSSFTCEEVSVCMNEDCGRTACVSSCSSVSRRCLSDGAENVVPVAAQHLSPQDVAIERHGSIQCPWILPGEPCDALVDTRNALGRHIYEKHIDPQLTLQCPLESCAQVVPRPNLPNHQAQQHQLDNYLCSWDSCADNTYPTSDDLFTHIMTNHNYVDCHFGGCEVSLKDPLQLQNHVVEDHLDYGFSWQDDTLFEPHFPLNEGPGFEEIPATQPGAESYDFGQDRGQYQMRYRISASPFTPNYNPPPNCCQHAPAQCSHAINQHRDHSPYANKAESVWRDSRSFHPPQPDLSLTGATTEANSPTSYIGSNTAVSELESRSDEHICKWIIDPSTNTLCNRAFHAAKDLQSHLRNDHCKQKKASRLAPKIEAICRWDGCGRKGEPLNDTHKLIRHALTHSDRRYHNVIHVRNEERLTQFYIIDRAFDCSHCGKVFKTKGERDNHERMHRGVKPFKCDVCGKACSNETQLTIHSRTHTGEKPYKCDMCNFCCADSTNLIKHKKTHGPKEFHCDVCGSDFGRKHTLERHRKQVHGKLGMDVTGARLRI